MGNCGVEGQLLREESPGEGQIRWEEGEEEFSFRDLYVKYLYQSGGWIHQPGVYKGDPD